MQGVGERQAATGYRETLEREMLELSARDRVRLTQELHDELREYFSALSFHTRILVEDLSQERSAHIATAERIEGLIGRTNELMRRLNRTLRVREIEAGEFSAVVSGIVTEFERGAGVRCSVAVPQNLPAIDEFQTVMLSCIVHEALKNCVRYSAPKSIRVSMSCTETALTVSVVHEGGQRGANGDGERMGESMLMRLRAELIGASFKTRSLSVSSHQIECVLPISNRRQKVRDN